MKKVWMPMAALVLALAAGCGGGGSDAAAGTAGRGMLGAGASTTGTPAADTGTAAGITSAPPAASGTASADAATASTNAAAATAGSSVPEAAGGAAVTPVTPAPASVTTTTTAALPAAGTAAPAAPAPDAASPAPSASTPAPVPAKGSTSSSPPAPTPYDLLVDQAEAKRKEVETLAVDGPCETDDQCGTLALEPTNLWWPSAQQSIDYSLVSPSANAAFAAAAEYNQLALQAQAVAPPNNAICGCFTNVSVTVLRCVARKCVRTQPWFEPSVEPATEAQPARRRH